MAVSRVDPRETNGVPVLVIETMKSPPFAECLALLACMSGDESHAKRMLKDLDATDLRAVEVAAQTLAWMALQEREWRGLV